MKLITGLTLVLLFQTFQSPMLNKASNISLRENEEVVNEVIPPEEDNQELFSVSSTHLTLNENESVYFAVTLLDTTITEPNYEVSYSVEGVVKVDLKAKQVVALAPGQVKVTIKLQDQIKEVSLTVKETQAKISFEESTFYLIRGLSYTIPYHIQPESLANKSVTWNSSNTAVATVVNGRVEGLKLGRTTITATVDGSVASMEVYVTAPLEGVAFVQSEVELTVGEKSQSIAAVPIPSDTTDQYNLEYRIEDESIVEFNDNNELVALKEGNTKIHVKVKNFSASLDVRVKTNENNDGIIEIHPVEKIVSSSQLEYSMDAFKILKNKQYSLVLDSGEISRLLSAHNEVTVSVFLDQSLLSNDFKQLSQLVLANDVVKNLDEKILHVVIKNNFGVTYAKYTFTHSSSSSIDLRYKLTAFYKGSKLGNLVGGNGYQLSLLGNQTLPLGTSISFPATSLGARQGITRFLYIYNPSDSTFNYANQAAVPNDISMIEFQLEKSNYLITETQVSLRKNDMIFTVLGGIAVVIVLVVVWVYYKDRKKA